MLFSTAGTAGKARLTIAPDGPSGEGSGLQEHIRGETGGRRGPAGRHRAASGGPRRGSGRGRRQGEPEWQAVSPTACRSGPPGPGLPMKKERLVLQQTSNYQLSQWDAEDRILREDFNGDNSKLDEALKSQAEALAAETAAREAGDAALAEQVGLHTIKSATLAASANSMLIDLSDIDWSQWKMVHIILELSGTGYFFPGYGTTYDTDYHYSFTTMCFTLFPFYRKALHVGGILHGVGKPSFIGPGTTYQAITSFSVNCCESNYSINAGSKITVLGEK